MIRVDSTRVYPTGDDFALAVYVSGTATGVLYLHLRLDYDCFTEIARIVWLDFEVDTRNTLLRLMRWACPVLLEGLRKEVTALKFEIGPTFRNLQEAIQTGLDGAGQGDVRIRSRILPIAVTARYNTDAAAVFRIRFGGTVRVSVSPHGESLPSGNEVRMVSVLFTTLDDNKDRTDEVRIQLWHDGALVAARGMWGNRELNDGQSGGPFYIPYNPGSARGTCGRDELRIIKVPRRGTNRKWNVLISAKAYYSDGGEKEVVHVDRAYIGQGSNPGELRFGLCF